MVAEYRIVAEDYERNADGSLGRKVGNYFLDLWEGDGITALTEARERLSAVVSAKTGHPYVLISATRAARRGEHAAVTVYAAEAFQPGITPPPGELDGVYYQRA